MLQRRFECCQHGGGSNEEHHGTRYRGGHSLGVLRAMHRGQQRLGRRGAKQPRQLCVDLGIRLICTVNPTGGRQQNLEERR